MNTTATHPTTTRFVDRDEGRIAYDDTGGPGPLVVLIPGMGDLRSQYRFVTAPLAAAGYRVVTVDLRGLGESDATFSQYNGEAVVGDIIALVEHLDAGPAVVMGNSMAAGSALVASAEAPELFSGFVLIGGFTRGPVMNWAMKLVVRIVMGGPWRNAAWLAMYDTLYPLAKPADHDAHRQAIRDNLREPGRSHALHQMFLSNHDYAEARYADVTAPSVFVMGTADSDFPDAAKEAQEVSAAIGGRVEMIEGAGHYPHIECPEAFVRSVLPFLAQRTGSGMDGEGHPRVA